MLTAKYYLAKVILTPAFVFLVYFIIKLIFPITLTLNATLCSTTKVQKSRICAHCRSFIDVVCVVSSKGSLSDSNVYATAFHGQNWDFPIYVVTKDEKNVFATGNSKYIPLLRKCGVKVYISNHNDYDKPTESGKWEKYEWCDVVNPEHVLHTDIHNRILETKSENEFFNWEK